MGIKGKPDLWETTCKYKELSEALLRTINEDLEVPIEADTYTVWIELVDEDNDVFAKYDSWEDVFTFLCGFKQGIEECRKQEEK